MDGDGFDTLAPDIGVMTQHLEHLFGGLADPFRDGLVELAWTDTRPGSDGRYKLRHARLFRVDEMDHLVQRAAELNVTPMRNVYIGAALRWPATPAHERASDKDVWTFTSVCCDLDAEGAFEANPTKLHDAAPTMTVITGAHPYRRGHLWWKLAEQTTDQDWWRTVVRGLTHRVSGDASIINPARVMRLGGSIAWPTKPGRVPELTGLVWGPPDASTYSKEALEDAAGGTHAASEPSRGKRWSRAQNGLGMDGKVDDGREAFMRDLILAVLVQFVGENGAAPSLEELFELGWPQYERNVDLDRPGRGPEEFRAKCSYTLGRFERGEIRGAASIDACVASYRQRQRERTESSARFHSSDGDGHTTAGERTGAEDSDRLITEDRAARIFAQRFEGKLRFCHQTGSWFRWTGTHWARDATGLAYNWTRELARELSIAEKNGVRYATNKTSFASGVEKFAKTDPTLAVTAEIWDLDPLLLGTPAGTVDLRTGELRVANPAEGITKLVAVAPTHRSDCPHWMRFLVESTAGDSELIRFLQQWAGYCLTGETREHALVFVFGPGGNGKSVFLNTVAGILGDYATSAAMDTFTAFRSDRHPTDLAMLRGARLVTATETEEGRSWAEARIKQLTGGDPVTARFMRQDFFTYRPQFKLTIIGNHRPVLASVDDATRRRFRLVPFTVRPTRPDRFLEDRLKEEWPGILRWMIDGCLDWQANGLTSPAVVNVATDAYFDEQDVFGQWLDEACDLTPEGSTVSTPAALLYGSWRTFAENAGENPGTMKSFVGRLQRAGSIPGRSAGKRVYHGIRLRRQPPKE